MENFTKDDLEQMQFEDFLDKRDDILSLSKIRLTARRLVNSLIGLYYVPCISENLQIKNYYYFFGKELVLNVECIDRNTTLSLLAFHKQLSTLVSREEFFKLARRYFDF